MFNYIDYLHVLSVLWDIFTTKKDGPTINLKACKITWNHRLRHNDGNQNQDKTVLSLFGAQGSHRLEKYLNIQDCLENSLKLKFALKSTWKKKHSKALKSPWILTFTGGFNSDFGVLNQYKIVAPLFGAAYAAPNKGTEIYTNYLKLIS